MIKFNKALKMVIVMLFFVPVGFRLPVNGLNSEDHASAAVVGFGTLTQPSSTDSSLNYGTASNNLTTSAGSPVTSTKRTSRPAINPTTGSNDGSTGTVAPTDASLSAFGTPVSISSALANVTSGSTNLVLFYVDGNGQAQPYAGANAVSGQNSQNGYYTPKDATGTTGVTLAGTTGLEAALYDMSTAATSGYGKSLGITTNTKWILYLPLIGGTSDIYVAKNTFSKGLIGSPTASNMNFASLTGTIGSLTLTGSATDPLTGIAQPASGTYKFLRWASGNTANGIYFGSATAFRNIPFTEQNSYMSSATNYYAQGNSLAFMPGSWDDNYYSTIIYGGVDSTGTDSGGNSSIASTNVYVANTSTNANGFSNGGAGGGWNIYGGNQAGGMITGSTHVTITGIGTNAIVNLSGGNQAGGTIQGNTNLDLTSASASIANIYGAGVGTSASPVTVNGNVKTNLSSTSANVNYGTFYGGVSYGNVGGTIYNNLTGTGTFASGSHYYFGGSYKGNIGNSAALGNAIFNNVDTSSFAYTTNGFIFGGGNGYPTNGTGSSTGAIYGNIVNYVRAGFADYGAGFRSVIGGNGLGSTSLSGLSAPSTVVDGTSSSSAVTAAASSGDQAAANAGKSASAVYGDIYTWEKGGNMDSAHIGYQSYNRGSSYTGYVRGSSTLEVGTAAGTNGETGTKGLMGGTGYVYGSMGGSDYLGNSISGTKSTYSINPLQNTNSATISDHSMEVIGVGGVVGGWTATDYWQTGDTNLIQNNDNAGYTYGGIYEGYQWGNSSNIMNNAIVNTLEGSSYQANTQYGNSLSIANNGSVEWFLAGGSWNTDNLVGNAQVDIYNGRYNGYVGGNYGANSGATITGNSNVNVYGGNFTSAKSLNGGSYNGGTVQGSSALNVNLSGANGSTFIPPASAMLSGTVPPGSSLKTGLGRATDTGSLEIILPANMTTAQKTAFASDTFYGDGAASGGSGGASNLSTVNVYVAPYGNGTGTIGSVYGTYYNNATGTGNGSSLRVTTNMTLGDGLTIAGTVSGSSSSSNYTNGLTTASSGTLNAYNSVNGGNSSNIYIGDTASSNPVTVTGSIINFTSITTQDNTVLSVSGQVLNGLNATAANHGATYSNFGTFNTGQNSTIAVNNSTLSMALGKLVINLNTTLQTPYLNSTGVINISYLDMYSDASTTGQQPTLHWVPPVNSVASVAPTSNYVGAFWGQQSGFPVLTFTGGSWASKASTAWGQGDNAPNQITPDNIGVDSSQNYAFLADYTPNVTNGQTGANAQYVGYFLPGTVREYVNNAASDSSTTSTWQYDASKFNITSTSTTSGLTAGITAKNPLQPFVPGGQPTLMTAYANVASKTPTADLVLEYPSTTTFAQPSGGVTYNASSGRYVSKISVQTYDSYAGLATPSGAVAVTNSGDTALPYTKTGLPSAMNFSAGTDSVNSKTDDDFLPGTNLNGSSSGGVGNYLVTTGADAVKTSVLSANAIIVRSADAISQFMTDGTNADSTLNVSALAKAMKVAGVGLMNNVTVQNMTAVQNAIESPVPATNAYMPVSVQWQGTDGVTQTAQLLIASNNSTSVGPSSVLTASMGVITSTQAAATTSVAPTDATLTSPQPNAISTYLSVEGMTAKSDGTVANHYNVNFVSASFGTGKFGDGSTTTTDATTFLNAVKTAKNGDKFVNIVFSYTDPTNNNQVVTTGPLELDVADQVLQFGSTPNYIDFGQQHMFTLQPQSINGRIANTIGGSDSSISVVDTRSTKTGWSLTAAMTAPLTNENNSDKNLADDVSVQSSPASSSVQHLSASSGTTALIYNESNSQAVTDNADGINAWNIGTDNGKPGTRQAPWANNAQFQLNTGGGQLWPGNYDGSLTWTLNDVPAN